MANKQKRRGTWDAVIGLVLTGLALLLPVALFSYHPRDIPAWVPIISTTTAANAVTQNLCGVVGAIVAGYLYFLFGAAAWLWIIVCGGYGLAKLATKDFSIRERVGWAFLFILSGASLLQLQPWVFQEWRTLQFAARSPGGWFGLWVGKAFGVPLGDVGAPVVLIVIYLASLVLAIGFHPLNVVKRAWTQFKQHRIEKERNRLEAMEETERMEAEQRKIAKQAEKLERQLKKKPPTESREPAAPEPVPTEDGNFPEPRIFDATVPSEKRPSLAEIEATRKKKIESKPSLASLRLENYQLPPLDLLDPIDEAGRGATDHAGLLAVQNTILETLKHFGISARAGDITKGPTITRFEVYPESGVRVDRITSLERDLARATRAQSINILAPIPGKDTVGIEIANSDKVKVTLRELLETENWLHSGAKLPLALGKDVYGKTIIADLAKMPHGLVAGTTGSGKSVCINSIIASLLFRYTPEELRFIMIDPKVVEMQIYNDLPHLVTPVVTDPKKVLLALRWVVDEMELRYQIFAKCGVRNVASFNERPLPKSQKELDEEKAAEEPPAPVEGEAPENGEDPPDEEPMAPPVSVRRDDEIIIPDRMPYIVVIIDELADLMQTAPADVESAVARIAQKARAAGIHLIVATQTPRADVVTGIIKANIPSRIAFQVASGLDSRVILDQKGAEKLVGQGDMLYLPPGTSTLVRAQGVLVTDEEIRAVVEFVSAQAKPNFEASMHEKLNNSSGDEEDVTEEDEELVQKVLEIMRQERRASTSLFQRRLRLGYTRAARIVDILEQRGIVGPRDGAKDREILVSLESLP